jgi:hypothetical protein
VKIIAVEPKDIHVIIDLSITQVGYLIDFLDRSKVVYNSDDEPEFVKAVDYVKSVFFARLTKVYDDVKGKRDES